MWTDDNVLGVHVVLVSAIVGKFHGAARPVASPLPGEDVSSGGGGTKCMCRALDTAVDLPHMPVPICLSHESAPAIRTCAGVCLRLLRGH